MIFAQPSFMTVPKCMTTVQDQAKKKRHVEKENSDTDSGKKFNSFCVAERG